jgi:phage FluMu protein Com
VVEIEIAPGEYLPLRGSRETLSAIESGKAQRVSCMACGVLLACISDCLMVICPECRCVSHTPNESDSSTIWLRLDDSDGAGGLGSGGYDGGSPFLNRSHNHRQLEPMGLNWWEREDDEHEGSFLGGFAARHRQEATMRRRASTSAISTQPKYGVGLGLKVEG